MFAVLRVKGDNREMLGKYDDLDTAKAEAKRIFGATKERCTISVIEAEFDENDEIVGGKYKLYKNILVITLLEVSVTVDEAGYRSNKMTVSLDYFIKKFNFF